MSRPYQLENKGNWKQEAAAGRAENQLKDRGLKRKGVDGTEKSIKGIDNTARRTWDKEDYAARELEREEREMKEEIDAEKDRERRQIVYRENLTLTGERATGTLDLAKMCGKQIVINTQAHMSKQGGWYCETCDCRLTDSANWLDHINGKPHQKALGMNMRVERSSLAQVKEKLVSGRLVAREPRALSQADKEAELEARLKDHMEKEQEATRRRRERRKLKKKEEKEASGGTGGAGGADEVDPETKAMMEAMGMPMGFGSSKC